MGEEVITDSLIAIFKATDLKGSLLDKSDETENFWIKIAEVTKIENIFEGLKNEIQMVLKGELFFEERIIRERLTC